MTLTPEEEQIAVTLNFDESVLRLVKSELQKPLKPFYSFYNSEISNGKGFTVKLAEAYDGFWKPDFITLVHRMRFLLLPYGYMAFLEGTHPYLAVLKTIDQSEIIRAVDTHGWDFDDKFWQAEELIAKLQSRRQLCDFNIIGAGHNNIKLEIETLPQDVFAFAEGVNHLCWELDQVYGIELHSGDAIENWQATEQLAQIIRETQRLYLWWD